METDKKTESEPINIGCYDGLKAPFPWFGGKSRAADLVWARFGTVRNYVEPFAGSLAVLLNRPIGRDHAPGNEIVNDLDCYVANAWRCFSRLRKGSIYYEENSRKRRLIEHAVAEFCDWPVNEADLHARHRWLHGRAEFRVRMENDPDYFDARIAGYWIWGLSCWIGDNFCRPKNQNAAPLLTNNADVNVPTKRPSFTARCGIAKKELRGQGVARKVPHMTGGQGVARKVPHMTGGQGVARKVPRLRSGGGGCQVEGENVPGIPNKRPNMDRKNGRGCHAMAASRIEMKRPALDAHKGFGSNAQLENLTSWFDALAQRLRHVKVCCGDWQRVCTKAATFGQGLTAVLLDPPYDTNCGLDRVYGDLHSDTVSAEVRAWAIEQGKNPLMRIALCGYEGGYAAAAGNTENSKRERIWFSPHCLKGEPELFKI